MLKTLLIIAGIALALYALLGFLPPIIKIIKHHKEKKK